MWSSMTLYYLACSFRSVVTNPVFTVDPALDSLAVAALQITCVSVVLFTRAAELLVYQLHFNTSQIRY